MAKTSKKESCPVATVASLVGDHWTLLIVRDLVEGPRRFGALAASLSGASTRTLAARLKKLADCGLVERTALGGRPPAVEYALTPRGTELGALIDAMRAYGKRHFPAA